MKHLAALTIKFLFAAVFVLAPGHAFGELFFVPIDGSNKHYAASDFGYQLKASHSANAILVHLELDQKAAKSFGHAELHLTKRREDVVTAFISLTPARGKNKAHLQFLFDPKIIDGGSLTISSDLIDGRTTR